MNKSLIALLAGVVIGYNGVRLMTHVLYLTVIFILLTLVVLR